MKNLIVALLVVAALTATGVVSAFSQSYDADEQGEGYLTGCVEDLLTEEQKEAVSEMIQELRDAGASSEEIREAVQQVLEELGINTEDCDKRRYRYEGFINDCVADQLTEEQKEAVSEMIQELRDAGASSEEIREAVQQVLEELGINTEKCQGAKGSKGTTGFKRNRA